MAETTTREEGVAAGWNIPDKYLPAVESGNYPNLYLSGRSWERV